MDKEAQEKIDKLLTDICNSVWHSARCGELVTNSERIDYRKNIFKAMRELGYRKPLDRPKLRGRIDGVMNNAVPNWKFEHPLIKDECLAQILALITDMPEGEPPLEDNIYWCEYCKMWSPPTPCPDYLAQYCKFNCTHRPSPKGSRY